MTKRSKLKICLLLHEKFRLQSMQILSACIKQFVRSRGRSEHTNRQINSSHYSIFGQWYQHSFIHSGYFYSTSSSPLLLRCIANYSIDTVSELTQQSATGNCEWRTCPRSLHGGSSGIWTCNPPDARHQTYHWSTTPHNKFQCCLGDKSRRVSCYNECSVVIRRLFRIGG